MANGPTGISKSHPYKIGACPRGADILPSDSFIMKSYLFIKKITKFLQFKGLVVIYKASYTSQLFIFLNSSLVLSIELLSLRQIMNFLKPSTMKYDVLKLAITDKLRSYIMQMLPWNRTYTFSIKKKSIFLSLKTFSSLLLLTQPLGRIVLHSNGSLLVQGIARRLIEAALHEATRNEVLRPSKDWRWVKETFPWWHHSYCFVFWPTSDQ